MASTEFPTLVHELLADAPFRERHARTIAAPIDTVWRACTDVTVGEIRLIGPLVALRTLPSRIRRRRRGAGTGTGTGRGASERQRPLLAGFADEGFVVLRADDHPLDGRASLDFGAAGRFWSATENEPVRFADADEFVEFARTRNQPGLAVTVANLCAVDNGDGTTTVTTETRIDGTDAASTRAFGRYWLVIRLGSGGIRRSWLAAIERRARR